MKNLLLASVLAAAALTCVPEKSQAFWNMPQSNAGYPCLGAWAINQHPSKFFEGPLYNYGPIVPGPGYQVQYVQQPLCGLYIPADPNTYIPLNYQLPNTWGYVNPGVAGTPGSLPAYYAYYYGMPGPMAPPPPPPATSSAPPVVTTPAPLPSSPTTVPKPSSPTGAPQTTSAPVMQMGASQMGISSNDITQVPVESSGSSPGLFKNLRARLQR